MGRRGYSQNPGVLVALTYLISIFDFVTWNKLCWICVRWKQCNLCDILETNTHIKVIHILIGKCYFKGFLYASDTIWFHPGNLHKWVFCPRSAAVLWVDPKHHHMIRPLMTSASYKSDDFRVDFVYTGTLDYTSLLCVKDGIQMHKDLGGRVCELIYR